ncbi:MAG TPA: tetratricopeptide repeat protein, partial [Terriglobia bacterium]|nr:tetratricopeptide repeat protein [Terriglobia bacterium]
SDLILLNVVGDLYAQENNVPEALKYFYRLAETYTREGFKVKAIAIYKKIAKMDRDKAEPLLKLAELNWAQGLAREAREQYKNAFDFFDRRGQKDKALEVLRRLCQLDLRSPVLRVKFAQFAETAGERREAAGAYLDAAALARDSGDSAACRSALDKAAELAPDNPEVHLQRARLALAEQKPEEIKGILELIPNLQSNLEAKRLLLQSCLATSHLDEAGDLLLDVAQSGPVDFTLLGDFAARCMEKGQHDLALGVLKAISPAAIARREAGPLVEILRRLWKSAPGRIDILELIYDAAEKSADESTIPEVLEALGNAYVELDQLDKAEQVYARLVAREPENETYKGLLRKVLEKQGKEYVPLSEIPLISSDFGLESIPGAAEDGGAAPPADAEQAAIVKEAMTNSDFFVRDGLTERAVEELEKVLRVYPEQSEIQKRILEVCREKLPGRAAQAAEELARLYTGRGDGSEARRYHEEALAQAYAAAGAETSASAPPPDESSAQNAEAVEVSPRSVEFSLSPAGHGEGSPAEGTELPPPMEISLDFQTPQTAEHAGTGPEAFQGTRAGEMKSPAPILQTRPAADTAPFNYEESREEIEFYIRHGFYDEAQRAVSELERDYPSEGRVSEFRQRVNELKWEPGPPAGAQAARAMGAEETPETEWELPTSFSGAAKDGDAPEAEQGSPESGPASGPNDAIEDLASELASSVEDFYDPAMSPVSSPPQPGHGASSMSAADASMDLGSLLEELNDTDESADQSADDEQTHYNLGVAFREMGLLDEAIGEFQKVVNGTGSQHFGPYFLQGCTLLASCFMDKEMPAIAAKWYLRALDAPDLNHEGALSLHYDLGIAFERAGNTTAALEKFTEVYSQNIDYRDVAEKIRLLGQTSR